MKSLVSPQQQFVVHKVHRRPEGPSGPASVREEPVLRSTSGRDLLDPLYLHPMKPLKVQDQVQKSPCSP
ncbi:hypothetical protein EYF80_058951 [Liparis tanakae]|uniref:Uncharacterized protein n=1 Tax=Liparis tanakae TaxID=230148 RepID=A0A4Z2EPR2_9TELE|nr:hypothetical protein EYF80_058951 [Liparis tanakae]